MKTTTFYSIMIPIYIVLFCLLTWIGWLLIRKEWKWPGAGPFAYSLYHKWEKKRLKRKKQIDESMAYILLAFIHEVFKEFHIFFWLSEGTALGFRRNEGFIKGDDDIDIGMWIDHLPQFIDAVHKLKQLGFQIAESKRGGTFVSFLWKGIILDVDITGPNKICTANYGQCSELIPHLQSFQSIWVYDKHFWIPQDSYFEYLYGHTWHIPSNTKPTLKTYGFYFV